MMDDGQLSAFSFQLSAQKSQLSARTFVSEITIHSPSSMIRSQLSVRTLNIRRCGSREAQ